MKAKLRGFAPGRDEVFSHLSNPLPKILNSPLALARILERGHPDLFQTARRGRNGIGRLLLASSFIIRPGLDVRTAPLGIAIVLLFAIRSVVLIVVVSFHAPGFLGMLLDVVLDEISNLFFGRVKRQVAHEQTGGLLVQLVLGDSTSRDGQRLGCPCVRLGGEVVTYIQVS
jgi:hypothetical protein